MDKTCSLLVLCEQTKAPCGLVCFPGGNVGPSCGSIRLLLRKGKCFGDGVLRLSLELIIEKQTKY